MTAEKIALAIDDNSALTVRKDSHIEYQNKFYSVDPKYIQKNVNIKEHEQYLLFYMRGVLIESHLKIINNLTTQSTKPEHLKPWQDTLLPTSSYRMAAKRIEDHCDRLIYTILQKGKGVVDNKNICAIINLKENDTTTSIK